MAVNARLKMRIMEKFGTQVDFATDNDFTEQRVSKVVRGRVILSPTEQKEWAGILECQPIEIFGNNINRR